MNFDIKNLKWIKEPKSYSINKDKIKLLQNHIRIYGKEHIIILEMIMHLCFKWRLVINTFFYSKD